MPNNLSLMIKPVSGSCNMNCNYCYYAQEIRFRKTRDCGTMSKEILENILKKALRCTGKVCSLVFQGGEPSLAGIDFYRQVVELEKTYNVCGVQINNSIQTNGYALNDEWGKFLSSNDFLVGLSVDGTRETHNAYRLDKSFDGTYDRVYSAARLLSRHNVRFNILTVVADAVAHHAESIYKEYQLHDWHWLQFIPCISDNNAPWRLTPSDYGEFLCKTFDLWYTDWKQQRQPYIRAFENYVAMLLGYRPESCDMCGSCSIQYAIEADGTVFPCDFYMLDEYRIGNLNTDSFEQLDQKRREIRFLEASAAVPEDCARCDLYLLCRNGCRRNRGLDGKSIYCDAYKTFFAHSRSRLCEIADSLR